MYIQTEENKIINFTHYRSVEVYEMTDVYALRAFLSIESKYDDIAYFDEKVDADYAISNLFKAILNNRTPWNVNIIKSLSKAWCKVKANNQSMVLLDNAKVSVSNTGEVVIIYASRNKELGDHDTATEINDQLKEAIGDKTIKIKWKPCDDLNR